MKRTPRYDPHSVDPYGIKTKLSKYGNTLYDQMWEQMGCPSNIVIGENTVECFGQLKDKRYGVTQSPTYDGIHQIGELGKAHYTGSVLKMFKISFPHLQNLPKFNSSSAKPFTDYTRPPPRRREFKRESIEKCPTPFPTNRTHKVEPWLHQTNYSPIPVYNRFNTLTNF